jgi:GxxExxY protein
VNELTENVIGAAMDVHRALGPGLLESTYELCLCHELSIRGIAFERQRPVAVDYKGVTLDCGYRFALTLRSQRPLW